MTDHRNSQIVGLIERKLGTSPDFDSWSTTDISGMYENVTEMQNIILTEIRNYPPW